HVSLESRRRPLEGDLAMGMIESRARATSDPEARREVLARVEQEKVDYILLWFTDLEGHLKSFAITLDELAGALDDGMGFDGSPLPPLHATDAPERGRVHA